MPIGKSKPHTRLAEETILIHGNPKAGKTTLAAQFPNAAFIATEAGLGHVSVSRWESDSGRYVVQSWEELLSATAEVIASKPETIVLDTIGNACLLCDQYVCKKFGEEYRGDGKLGFNKGVTLIIAEIRRYLTKLSSLNIGLVMIAHTAIRAESTRAGEVQKSVPFLPGDNKSNELANAIVGMCDLALYCTQDGDKRTLRTKPHPTYIAGDRSGKLPDPMPMTYAALAAAYAIPAVATA